MINAFRRTYLVRCPKCGRQQRTSPYGEYPIGKRKKCVYGNHSFIIHKGGIDTSIIKEIL